MQAEWQAARLELDTVTPQIEPIVNEFILVRDDPRHHVALANDAMAMARVHLRLNNIAATIRQLQRGDAHLDIAIALAGASRPTTNLAPYFLHQAHHDRISNFYHDTVSGLAFVHNSTPMQAIEEFLLVTILWPRLVPCPCPWSFPRLYGIQRERTEDDLAVPLDDQWLRELYRPTNFRPITAAAVFLSVQQFLAQDLFPEPPPDRPVVPFIFAPHQSLDAIHMAVCI